MDTDEKQNLRFREKDETNLQLQITIKNTLWLGENWKMAVNKVFCFVYLGKYTHPVLPVILAVWWECEDPVVLQTGAQLKRVIVSAKMTRYLGKQNKTNKKIPNYALKQSVLD